MSKTFEPTSLLELRTEVAPILVGLIPGELNIARAVLAAVMCERALGSVWLAPQYTYCPGGPPRWNAEGCRAILIRAGVKCEITVQTPERCELHTHREGHTPKVFVWTSDRAKRAGLLNPPAPGKKVNCWHTQPERMLAARCWTEAGSYYADLLGASTVDDQMPTDEEMQYVQTEVETDRSSASATTVATAAPVAAASDASAHLTALRARASAPAPAAPVEEAAPVVVAPVIDVVMDTIRTVAKSSGWAKMNSPETLREFGLLLGEHSHEARRNLAEAIDGCEAKEACVRLTEALEALRSVKAAVVTMEAEPVAESTEQLPVETLAVAPRVLIMRAFKSLQPDVDTRNIAAWLKKVSNEDVEFLAKNNLNLEGLERIVRAVAASNAK